MREGDKSCVVFFLIPVPERLWQIGNLLSLRVVERGMLTNFLGKFNRHLGLKSSKIEQAKKQSF